jgi:hypothetical protein
VAPVTIWEDSIVVGKRSWPVDVALIICVRLAPNDGGVLNEVAEVKEILLDMAVGSVEVVVIEVERVPLEFEETRSAQDVGLFVIRMIPEPT